MRYIFIFVTIFALFSGVHSTQAAEPLELWRLSQYTGTPGDKITVTGKGFSPETKVQLHTGGRYAVEANTTYLSSTSLSFTIPDDQFLNGTTVSVTVHTNTIYVGNNHFLYINKANSTPELWRLSKYNGTFEDVITVTGKNFINQKNVKVFFNSIPLPTQVIDDATLRVTLEDPREVSESLDVEKTYAVTIKSDVGQSASQNFYFTHKFPLEFWNISKYQASTGEKVTLRGKGFSEDVRVFVSGEKLAIGNAAIALDKKYYRIDSDTTITLTIPEFFIEDGTYAIQLDVLPGKYGRSTNSQSIYIKKSGSGNLELWQLSKYKTFPGEKLTLSGQGFTATTEVRIGDTTVSAEKENANTLSIKIPASIPFGKTYPLKVIDGEKKSASQDLYIKDPRWEN